MRNYKSAVADILATLTTEASAAGVDDMGALVNALHAYARDVDAKREAMRYRLAVDCSVCGRAWAVTLTPKRERTWGVPEACPACHDARLTPEMQARRGVSGLPARWGATYADGSPFPVLPPQSIWIRCDVTPYTKARPAHTAKTWIRKVDGVPVEAATLDTDAGAHDSLARYWGEGLSVGAWAATDALAATTVPYEKAPPTSGAFRVAPLALADDK